MVSRASALESSGWSLRREFHTAIQVYCIVRTRVSRRIEPARQTGAAKHPYVTHQCVWCFLDVKLSVVVTGFATSRHKKSRCSVCCRGPEVAQLYS